MNMIQLSKTITPRQENTLIWCELIKTCTFQSEYKKRTNVRVGIEPTWERIGRGSQ